MKLRDIDLRAHWNYGLEEHGKEDAENGKRGLHAASRKFRPLFVSLSCFVVTQRKGANCFTHAVWQCRFQISSLSISNRLRLSISRHADSSARMRLF